MAYEKINYNPGDVLTADQMNKIQDEIISNNGNIEGHIENTENPHGVTAEQVGARPNTWTPSASDVGALPKTGGTMSGAINMDGKKITNLATPTSDADASTKKYVDDGLDGKQDTITGAITPVLTNNFVTGRVIVSDSNGKLSANAITTDELSKLDGVTANIQTQIDNKQDSITLNASVVPISNASGKIVSSNITATELGYLDGVTSNIQTQMDGKAPLINRGNFSGDLDIIGDGGVQLNSVVWVSKDAKSPFPDSWGWVETWASQSNSIVQRATQINGKTWVRVYYYKNSTVGAVWGDWIRIDSLDSAPAGYGLGTAGVYNSSVDSLFVGGFYRWDTDNSQTPFANGTMVVLPRNDGTRASQLAICNSGTGTGVIAVRSTKTDAVGEWLYVNPVMNPGTEYLTSEFWNNGKPVYKKLVKMGKLTTEFVEVAHGASLYYVVGVEAMAIDETNKVSFPIAYTANDNVADTGVYVDTTNVTIHNPQLLSNYSGYVIIKYVK